MMLAELMTLCSRLLPQENRRRAAAVRLTQQSDLLEARTLLSGTNPAPEFGAVWGLEGELFIEVNDAPGGNTLNIEIDVDSDGSVEQTATVAANSSTVESLHTFIPPNTTKNVTIKVTEEYQVFDEELNVIESHTHEISTSLDVAGVTLTPHPFLWIDGYHSVVMGQVDLTDRLGSVHVMYREVGETTWNELTEVDYNDEGRFAEIFMEADGVRDWEFATKTSLFGTEVFGAVHTIENLTAHEPTDGGGVDSGGNDPADPGMGATPGGSGDDDDDGFWGDYPGI